MPEFELRQGPGYDVKDSILIRTFKADDFEEIRLAFFEEMHKTMKVQCFYMRSWFDEYGNTLFDYGSHHDFFYLVTKET